VQLVAKGNAHFHNYANMLAIVRNYMKNWDFFSMLGSNCSDPLIVINEPLSSLFSMLFADALEVSFLRTKFLVSSFSDFCLCFSFPINGCS